MTKSIVGPRPRPEETENLSSFIMIIIFNLMFIVLVTMLIAVVAKEQPRDGNCNHFGRTCEEGEAGQDGQSLAFRLRAVGC